MAILKFVNNSQRNLNDMIAYITDPKKACPDSIFGIGVNPAYAIEEFKFIRQIWPHSYNMKPYQQVILSLDSLVDKNLQFKKLFLTAGQCLIHDDRQVIGAIHYNTANIHCHYIINNIGINGSCYKQQQSVISFKRRINEILNCYLVNEIYYYKKIA
ncbi:relaxase/mobilization nuclease domain-containing protein [Pectinatus haikarae]|uniref:MobA/VirD2-like nuclease domain-containing protein n=1 Tax=Pectinatus haikarae TaxID=349096 RepID=A0ABT9Y6L1_9FIRM|nr:hypothetical protein [Pectinatus haikarae]MDQ0202842.1 hypothetical protein [Pectinatus haikarae]